MQHTGIYLSRLNAKVRLKCLANWTKLKPVKFSNNLIGWKPRAQNLKYFWRCKMFFHPNNVANILENDPNWNFLFLFRCQMVSPNLRPNFLQIWFCEQKYSKKSSSTFFRLRLKSHENTWASVFRIKKHTKNHDLCKKMAFVFVPEVFF